MERVIKFLVSYKVQLLCMVIVVFVTIISVCIKEDEVSSNKINKYNNNWTCKVNSQQIDYGVLPDKIDSINSDEVIILQKKLPDEIVEGDAIVFFMLHNYIKVSVDDEVIKEISYNSDTNSKTPGVGWIFAKLKKDYEGKDITIEMYSKHSRYTGDIPDIYYGNETVAVKSIIKNNFFGIVICVLLMFVGMALTALYVCVGKILNLPKQILWLGIFAILFSIWSFSDISVIQIFTERYLLMSQITFCSLFLLFLPMAKFFKITYGEEHKILDIMCGALTIIIVLATILQIIGKVDLCQWGTIINYLTIIMATWAVTEGIKYICKKSKEERKLMHIYLLAIILMCIGTIIDGVRYLLFNVIDTSMVSRVTFLICLIIFSGILIKRTIIMYQEHDQLIQYKESSMFDVLTKTANRATFEKDCLNIYSDNPEKYGIVMFDLNDLKFFNDKYGHSTGDYYIIVCSEIIQDIFGYEDGNKVYRTGGDEFCAVMKNIDYNKYCEMVAEMKERLEVLNKDYFDEKMGIASGYAHFDSDIDLKIQDTIRRADQAMYENKVSMKSKINFI